MKLFALCMSVYLLPSTQTTEIYLSLIVHYSDTSDSVNRTGLLVAGHEEEEGECFLQRNKKSIYKISFF